MIEKDGWYQGMKHQQEFSEEMQENEQDFEAEETEKQMEFAEEQAEEQRKTLAQRIPQRPGAGQETE